MGSEFEERFERTAWDKVFGGPKTTRADRMCWRGSLRAGIPLVLTTIPRTISTIESFLTPSPMRLRDSFVGRGGYFIDVAVEGEASDEDLLRIAELASQVDPRPVLVRRKGVGSSQWLCRPAGKTP